MGRCLRGRRAGQCEGCRSAIPCARTPSIGSSGFLLLFPPSPLHPRRSTGGEGWGADVGMHRRPVLAATLAVGCDCRCPGPPKRLWRSFPWPRGGSFFFFSSSFCSLLSLSFWSFIKETCLSLYRYRARDGDMFENSNGLPWIVSLALSFLKVPDQRGGCISRDEPTSRTSE